MFYEILLLILIVFLFLLFWLLVTNKREEPVKLLKDEETFLDANNKQQIFSFNSLVSDEITLSVVIPAYNEQFRLGPMMTECIEYLEEKQKSSHSFRYEIVIVNDGSSDDTYNTALSWTKQNDNVRVLNLSVNKGKGGALIRGVLVTRGSTILIADADGATKFSEYDKLQRALEENVNRGHGIACGSRAHMQKDATKKRGKIRNLLMWGFHWVVHIVGGIKNIQDTQCGFKLFTRDSALLLFPALHIEKWAFDVELLWLAQQNQIPVLELPVEWKEIAGSHLEEEDTRIVSVKMFFDLLRFRLSYELRLWKMVTRK